MGNAGSNPAYTYGAAVLAVRYQGVKHTRQLCAEMPAQLLLAVLLNVLDNSTANVEIESRSRGGNDHDTAGCQSHLHTHLPHPLQIFVLVPSEIPGSRNVLHKYTPPLRDFIQAFVCASYELLLL